MLAKCIFLTLAIAVTAENDIQAQQNALIIPMLFQGLYLKPEEMSQIGNGPSDNDIGKFGYLISAPTLWSLQKDVDHFAGDSIQSLFRGAPVLIETRATGDSVFYIVRNESKSLNIEMTYNNKTQKIQYHEVRIESIPVKILNNDMNITLVTFSDMNEVNVQPDLSFQCNLIVLMYFKYSDGFYGIIGIDNADFISTRKIHGIAYKENRTYSGTDILTSIELLTTKDAEEIKKLCLEKLSSAGSRADEYAARLCQDSTFEYAGKDKRQSFYEMLAAMPWRPNIQ